jgi:hypothetical protein
MLRLTASRGYADERGVIVGGTIHPARRGSAGLSGGRACRAAGVETHASSHLCQRRSQNASARRSKTTSQMVAARRPVRGALLHIGQSSGGLSTGAPRWRRLLCLSRELSPFALCAQFNALERQIKSLYPDEAGSLGIEDDDERDRTIEPLCEKQLPLVKQICTTTATTVDGLRAKAASIALWAPDYLTEDQGQGFAGKMTASLLCDLQGFGEGAV